MAAKRIAVSFVSDLMAHPIDYSPDGNGHTITHRLARGRQFGEGFKPQVTTKLPALPRASANVPNRTPLIVARDDHEALRLAVLAL